MIFCDLISDFQCGSVPSIPVAVLGLTQAQDSQSGESVKVIEKSNLGCLKKKRILFAQFPGRFSLPANMYQLFWTLPFSFLHKL